MIPNYFKKPISKREAKNESQSESKDYLVWIIYTICFAIVLIVSAYLEYLKNKC